MARPRLYSDEERKQRQRAYKKQWVAANRDRVNLTERTRRSTLPHAQRTLHSAQYRTTMRGRAVLLFISARKRARQRGLPFTITKSWVEQKLAPMTCAVSGRALVLDRPDATYMNPLAPSLDRITPAAGYTPDNVRVVCSQANTALSEYGVDSLLALAEDIRQHQAAA